MVSKKNRKKGKQKYDNHLQGNATVIRFYIIHIYCYSQ